MDLVWSRMEGYPWWPGVLLTDEERLATGVELPEDSTYNALVKNFGTNDITPVDKGDSSTIQPFFTSSTISMDCVDGMKLRDAELYTQDITLTLAVQEAFAHCGLEHDGLEWLRGVENRRQIVKENDYGLLQLDTYPSDSKAEIGVDVSDDDRNSLGDGLSSRKVKKEKRKHKKSKDEKRKRKKEKREHRKRHREENDDDENEDNENDDARTRRRRRVLRERTRSVPLKDDAIMDRRKRAGQTRSRGGKGDPSGHRSRANDSDREEMTEEHDSAYIDAITYGKRRITDAELEGIRDNLVVAMEAGNVSDTRTLLRVLCDLEVSYKQLVFTGIGVVVGELLNTSNEFVALSQFYSIASALLECWFYRLDEECKRGLIIQEMEERRKEEEKEREGYRHLEDDDLGAYIQEIASKNEQSILSEGQWDMSQEPGLGMAVV
eukprot:Tbor_TRINITY_DN2852_c0_g1::TRINITY_DN2852_c0_g1_i1::g.23257::m.23257